MENLLITKYIDYINSRRLHISPCSYIGIDKIKMEVIDELCFDIKDLHPTIKQALGTGSATYENKDRKLIAFIDYEHFMNQLPADKIKGLKKPDFIAYDLESKSFFLVNELSMSKTAKGKLNDARQQLQSAIFRFSKVPEIAHFIDTHERKLCVFSNKSKLIPTPDDMAKSFFRIQSYLGDPIKHDYHPIKTLGYEFIETAVVSV